MKVLRFRANQTNQSQSQPREPILLHINLPWLGGRPHDVAQGRPRGINICRIWKSFLSNCMWGLSHCRDCKGTNALEKTLAQNMTPPRLWADKATDPERSSMDNQCRTTCTR